MRVNNGSFTFQLHKKQLGILSFPLSLCTPKKHILPEELGVIASHFLTLFDVHVKVSLAHTTNAEFY